jgi:hypothetical protein
VVAAYPGAVWDWEELRKAGGSSALDPQGCNDYLLYRLDGRLLDPTFTDLASPPTSTAAAKEMLTNTKSTANPYAVGAYINHPPSEVLPNVISWMVELTETEIAEYGPIIPNTGGS